MDRGRKLRGTTSGSPSPHSESLTASNNACAISGGPVFPYCYFRKATPGGISAVFPTALHQPAVLWRKAFAYFFPSLCYWGYPSKNKTICQEISIIPKAMPNFEKLSNAFFCKEVFCG